MTQTEIIPESREIVATLTAEAPRAAVWKAYIEPAKVRRWWPFAGMTMPVCDADVRVGGGYRFVGRVASGDEFAFRGEYREVVENERLVHTEVYEAFPDAEAVVTNTFADHDGGTVFVSRTTFPTDEAFRGAVDMGLPDGMKASLDRLAEVAGDRELSITRLIDVPRDRLFAGWINPELLKQWWAPRPLTVSECELDLRPGGVFRTKMVDPEGKEYDYAGLFLEVVPNERLVFTDAFGPNWQPKPNPFMVGVITFEEEDGQTRYTARSRHWSVETRDQHEAMGFEAGWNQCLDQLVEVVGA